MIGPTHNTAYHPVRNKETAPATTHTETLAGQMAAQAAETAASTSGTSGTTDTSGTTTDGITRTGTTQTRA